MRRVCLVVLVVLAVSPVALAQDDADTRRVAVEIHDEGCPGGEDRFCVLPERIEADEGRDLVLEVTNEGAVRHNVTAAGVDALEQALDERVLEPGEEATIELSWEVLSEAREEIGDRRVALECGFDGHADLGERVVILVGEEEQQPQPGFTGSLAVLGVLVAALVAWRRS